MSCKSIERLLGTLSLPLAENIGNMYRLSILFTGEILFMCQFHSAYKPQKSYYIF